MLELDKNKFIQENSPDGGFLQSEEWRKFQEAVGRKTFCISDDKFHANIIEHQLPIVGRYFYIPRGPVMQISNFQFPISNKIQNSKLKTQNSFSELMDLARKTDIGWIRIEPADEKVLKIISKAELFQNQSPALKIKKAPHDMQPGEILVMDIVKSEEDLLAEMKAKTRYNIKLSQKRGVSVKVISNFKFQILNQVQNPNDKNFKFYIDEFIRLVKITAKRDGITPHPEDYYRKMFETIPAEILKLYVAEYEGKVIAANIVIHYGNMATYLHGASDNKYRNVMAPYLLQWQAIQDAKKAGCHFYNLGGVKMSNPKSKILNPEQISIRRLADKIQNSASNSWQGITRFKTGFSPNTQPVVFPGSHDIIVDPRKYFFYKLLQKTKSFFASQSPFFFCAIIEAGK